MLGECTKTPVLVALLTLNTPIKSVREDEDYKQRMDEIKFGGIKSRIREVAETELAKREVEAKLNGKRQTVANYEKKSKWYCSKAGLTIQTHSPDDKSNAISITPISIGCF